MSDCSDVLHRDDGLFCSVCLTGGDSERTANKEGGDRRSHGFVGLVVFVIIVVIVVVVMYKRRQLRKKCRPPPPPPSMKQLKSSWLKLHEDNSSSHMSHSFESCLSAAQSGLQSLYS